MKKFIYHIPNKIKVPKNTNVRGYIGNKIIVSAEKEIKELAEYLVKMEKSGELKQIEKEVKEVAATVEKDLESMTYKELQKLAKEKGVSSRGKKTEIIERIKKASQ